MARHSKRCTIRSSASVNNDGDDDDGAFKSLLVLEDDEDKEDVEVPSLSSFVFLSANLRASAPARTLESTAIHPPFNKVTEFTLVT
eukprot:13278987-Ditylum_brightwellii.AAC.1